MELKDPRTKRRPMGRPRPNPQHPLPVSAGLNSGEISTLNCTGRYNGDCVVVNNPEEMARLNGQGHFGKGSLSRSFPVFNKVYKAIPPFIRERQWKRRSSWAMKNITDVVTVNSHICEETNVPSDHTLSEGTQTTSKANSSYLSDDRSSVPERDGSFVVVLNDSDSEMEDELFLSSLQSRVEQVPCPVLEELHLTLEESFFLSYALGCLKVFDLMDNKLSVVQLWRLCMETQQDFVEMYVAYHYFRAKGWVVKPGLKFGGDYLLYKQGPSFYHASYIVRVQVLNRYRSTTHNPINTWKNVMGLSRLAETAAKELLICQVVWPTECSEEALESPKILSKFTVRETLVRRWVAAQERDQEEYL